MHVAAFVPIKLNSERVPGKNVKPFRDGTPLMSFIQRTLLQAETVGEIYVYCSQERVREYLLPGVGFLKRDEKYDCSQISINEVCYSFSLAVPADIYVMAHATAPFLKAGSVDDAVNKVIGGEYDSALSVRRMYDFLWQNGRPMNYDPRHIPRTQDLPPLYKETAGVYVYTRNLIQSCHTRIGARPYLQEVTEIEAIDIDYQEDFMIADAIHAYLTRRGGRFAGALPLDAYLAEGGVAA